MGVFLLGWSLTALLLLLGAGLLLPPTHAGTAIFERRTDFAGSGGLPGSSEAIRLTLNHDLAGRSAIAAAAGEVGLIRRFSRDGEGLLTTSLEAEEEEIVAGLANAVRVTFEVRSEHVDLISVSLEHQDPRIAQQIPNRLVKHYMTRTAADILSRLAASKRFLEDVVGTYTTRLKELNSQRIDFEVEHAGMMHESPAALQLQIESIHLELETFRLEEKRARQTLARVDALAELQAKTAAPATQPFAGTVQVVKGPNPELRRLDEELRDYRRRLDTAVVLNRLTDKHPTVLTLRSKIADLADRIRSTPAEIVLYRAYGVAEPDQPGVERGSAESTLGITLSAQRDAVGSTLGLLAWRLRRLEKRRARLQEFLANFAPLTLTYLELVWKIADQETELTAWRQRLREVSMALAAEAAHRRTQFRAVQLAQRKSLPDSPQLSDVLVVAFGLPIVIGAILALLLRRRRRSRIFVPLAIGLLIVAVGLATLNIVLRLHHPDAYQIWQDAPVRFLWGHVRGWVASA